MTSGFARSLSLACLLGSLALLVETSMVARMVADFGKGVLFQESMHYDFSRLEMALLRETVWRDTIHLQHVSGIGIVLCALPIWLAFGASRLAPIRSIALGLFAVLVSVFNLPEAVARANIAYWGLSWRDIPVERLAYYVKQGHLVSAVRIPDVLILPLEVIPYVLPIPGLALVALGIGGLLRKRMSPGGPDEAVALRDEPCSG